MLLSECSDFGLSGPKTFTPATTIMDGLAPPRGGHMNETSAGRVDGRPDRSEVVRKIHFTVAGIYLLQ